MSSHVVSAPIRSLPDIVYGFAGMLALLGRACCMWVLSVGTQHRHGCVDHLSAVAHVSTGLVASNTLDAPCRAVYAAWLLAGQLQKMVLVVSSAASKDVLERWTFDVLTDREAAAGQCARVVNLTSSPLCPPSSVDPIEEDLHSADQHNHAARRTRSENKASADYLSSGCCLVMAAWHRLIPHAGKRSRSPSRRSWLRCRRSSARSRRPSPSCRCWTSHVRREGLHSAAL